MHSILSPLLFAVIIHCVMKNALTNLNIDLQWAPGSYYCDLVYKDNIVLLDTLHESTQMMTEAVEKRQEDRVMYVCGKIQKCGLI